ncbi:SBE2.2 [Symbiodinium sp. CCMP2592]|nr:SBE2.2 [Symbiodinium sp. CCMP2592]
MALKVFDVDPTLNSVGDLIWERVKSFRWWKDELEKLEGGIAKFAQGYHTFGFTRQETSITYREWLPNAKQVFLIGEFNKWENTVPLKSEGFGHWSVQLKDLPGGKPAIPHKSQVKVRVETNDRQWIERVPAWTRLAWQDPNTNLFNGVFWSPPKEEQFVFKHDRPLKPASPKIYEAHVGMSSKEPKVATYVEFAESVLPRIKRLGYNTVQLMAVAEHAFYGSFGYHVTSYFAPSSRCGTPEELKKLVDRAHALGLTIIMDLVHAHCSSNSLDGIAMMDGTDHCYTHGGLKGHHAQWDSKLFHYTKHEVLRFLLSNIRYWLEEFRFDGFRFDGVTSMLYHSHGIGKGYCGSYHDYFGGDADFEGQVYLMLANDLIHSLVPSAISVAEEVSGMPTLCLPIEDGGFGFDYRLAMAIPDMFIKLLKEVPDDCWDVGHICHTLTNRRWKEKCIGYLESHDQSIVGDKTIAFWLMDQEMYYGMSMAECPEPSIVVDRGLALHKVLRLLVLGLGGAGYLNFMGNEFGHPEWVDFPQASNDWSHHLCRRRWDLPDDQALRYKYFQNFDELMQALENRFKWLSSEHEFVTVCNAMDKVLVFERGSLTFVVNLDPGRSFQGYKVGIGKDEAMRIVLDTDEERFGGHCRLEEGHGKPLPSGGPTHNRPASCLLYIPARTAQVLAPASMLEGGIRVWLDARWLKEQDIDNPTDVNLALEIRDGGKKYLRQFRFNAESCVTLHIYFDAIFALIAPNGSTLTSPVWPDEMFHIYFPGDYTVCSGGVLEADVPKMTWKPAPISRQPSVVGTAAPSRDEFFDPSIDAGLVYPEAMVLGPNSMMDLLDSPAPTTPSRASASASASPSRTPSASATPKKGLSRSSSFSARRRKKSPTTAKATSDEVDDSSKEKVTQRAPLSPEERKALCQGRAKSYKEAFTKLGSLESLATAFKDFGLHHGAGGRWKYREWVPNAKATYLFGDFNGWNKTATPLMKSKDHPEIWCCQISIPLNSALTRGSQYRLHVVPNEGEPWDMVPTWATRCAINAKTKDHNAVVWPPRASRGPSKKDLHPSLQLKGKKLHLYELDITLAIQKGQKPSLKFARSLLPRAAHSGYHGVLLQGLYNGKGRFATGSLMAVSPVLGDSSDFSAFLQKAHDLGLAVILELPSGADPAESSLPAWYFRAEETKTLVKSFDFARKEVAQHILCSIKHWVEVGVDGFRMDGMPGPVQSGAEDTETAVAHFAMIVAAVVRSAAQEAGRDVILVGSGDIDATCDSLESGGFGCDFCQADGADLSRLLPGSRRLVIEPGPPSKARPLEKLERSLMEPLNSRTECRSLVMSCMESTEDFIVSQGPLSVCMLAWETVHTVSGGVVAPYVTYLSEALVRRGHEVHVFTRASHGIKINVETVKGVVYHEVPYQLSMDFVEETGHFCKALAAAVTGHEAAYGPFDVVHGHEWLVARTRAELRKEVRSVLTIHSTEQGRSSGADYGGQSDQVIHLEGEAFNMFDKLFAASQTVRDSVYSQYDLKGKEIQVVHNGAETIDKFTVEMQTAARDDLCLEENKPVLLFSGRLLPQKGPDVLLEAVPFVLRHWRDAHFIIAGSGHLRGGLERRAAELNVEESVTFAKALQPGTEEHLRYMAACDAVVIPARQDFYGVSVIESWAAGRPVVGCSCGELPRLVQPNVTGYLIDQESGSIAWGLCKICENLQHARWMGEQGQQQVQQHFLWDFLAKRTEEVYLSLLGLEEAPAAEVAKIGRSPKPPLAASLGHGATALLKLGRLLFLGFGGDATLTCLGSDFGWIGKIDFPRKSNEFSDEHARFPVEVASDAKCHYKNLAMFQMCLLRTERSLQWLADPKPEVIYKDEKKQVLVFTRGVGSIFALNFNTSDSNFNFDIRQLKGVSCAFKTVFNTQDKRFGGPGSGTSVTVPAEASVTEGTMKLLLPAQTGVVLVPALCAEGLSSDKTLQLQSSDAFVDLLADDQSAVCPISVCKQLSFADLAADFNQRRKQEGTTTACEAAAKSEAAEQLEQEAAKNEAARREAAEREAAEQLKQEAAKKEAARKAAAERQAALQRKQEAVRKEAARREAAEREAEQEAAKKEAARREAAEREAEQEAAKKEAARREAAEREAEQEAAKKEAARREAAEREAEQEAAKKEAARREAAEREAEQLKQEAAKNEAARRETAEPANEEEARKEAARKAAAEREAAERQAFKDAVKRANEKQSGDEDESLSPESPEKCKGPELRVSQSHGEEKPSGTVAGRNTNNEVGTGEKEEESSPGKRWLAKYWMPVHGWRRPRILAYAEYTFTGARTKRGSLLFENGLRVDGWVADHRWLTPTDLPLSRWVDRALCAEAQLLTSLCQQRELVNLTGEVELYTSSPPCLSCLGLFFQFRGVFPHATLRFSCGLVRAWEAWVPL